MSAPSTTELLLIRHAPARHGGCMAGRRDVAADLPEPAVFHHLRAHLGQVDRWISSPAMRCVQTGQALGACEVVEDARLWEQDFGQWEGMAFDDLPDLGSLTRAQLSVHRAPGGESFADICARIWPALDALAALQARVAVVAHAGVVRAGLARALGSVEQGLTFAVAPLSVTRITVHGADWGVAQVNWTPDAA
ncbi:hypothetical protein BFP70_07590 [Thioclava sp. SK-1]|uniref:histidine phosphatase family protein n=1 Tax=Thioclava sp. SK-1 TaxID=1889770 RepID=UPI000825CC98|nr:histidine phosphatase family protein [Thioclava sp. SK-1]OCX65977.1 hypothetical protein BFP70_07590 [Thioclava sp. SK-1]